MNSTNSTSTASIIFQSLATAMPRMLPVLIISAIGFTFALMILQKQPKAAKLTMAGCVLLALSTVYPIIASAFISRLLSTSESSRFLYSVVLGLPSFAAAVCLYLAAFADRPSDGGNKPPMVR